MPGASPPLAAVPFWVHGAGSVLERGCAARWWGGEQKPGVCCLAVLFFSSSPPLLPPSADCHHPGLGRSQICRDKWVLSGCRAGVGGEGSEPACPVLHGGAAGMLLPITAQHQQGLLRRSLFWGEKELFHLFGPPHQTKAFCHLHFIPALQQRGRSSLAPAKSNPNLAQNVSQGNSPRGAHV